MQTIKITTAQNIDIEYQIAGLIDRIFARLIDYAIFLGIYLVAALTVIGLAYKLQTNQIAGLSIVIVMIGIWLLLCVFYDLLTEIFLNGQSIGKRALKIKVISLDGKRPKVGQYLLRWIFRIVDFGVTLGSGAILSVVLTENKQRIGDIIAGTVLVKTEHSTSFGDLVFNPLEITEYEPTFAAARQLTDQDIVLIHDVIKNFNRTRNSMLIYKLAMQIKKHLNISDNEEINDYQFLEIILTDYKHLTVQA